jgi:membrane protease YdiL (CAAX protease family)
LVTDKVAQPQRVPQPRGRLAGLIAYVIAFHAVWAGWVYLIYPRLEAVGAATLLYALLNIGLRLLIWVLPVLLYLRYVDRVDPIEYLKLRQHWRRGVAVGLGLTAINALGTLLRFGVPHPSLQAITWNSILGTSILIGFIEEIPYRGFILQQMQHYCPFWAANLITSLLFVGIHLPGWIALHSFSIGAAVTIFIFGVIMALAFHYSKSLWSVIIAHSLNDFLTSVIFHL